jgi:gluconolactonase
MKRLSKLLLSLVIYPAILFPVHAQVFSDADVELIASGFQFVEGPVWIDGVGLLFSDIPANTIYKWTEEDGAVEYISPSGNSNGLAVDLNGALIICQHGPRQVGILNDAMDIEPLATHYDEKRLNSPNDLAIHSDGSVFFTDPPYGLNDQGGTSETGYNGIYRLDPDGIVQLLDSTLVRPNGIAFSPDESILYVSDSEIRRIYAWDVTDDSTLSNKREFATMQPAGYADGMKVDSNGYIFATGPVGVWIYAPDGSFINTISVPGQTSNCCWGDADRKALYVTSGNAVYRLTEKEPVTTINPVNGFSTNKLLANYPNPFSGTTTIPFYINEHSTVILKVHDILGKPVVTLLNADLDEGFHTVSWQPEDIAPGNYFIVLETNGQKTTRLSQISSSEGL